MAEVDRRALVGPPRARIAVALGALWLVTALLAARQAAEVLRLPRGERLVDLETWIGEGGVLRVRGSLYESAAFTGTPFSGLVLKPLARAAEESLGVVWTLGTLLLLVALGLVVAWNLPGPGSRRISAVAAPVVISLMVLSGPVRNTFMLGQMSLLPVLLGLLGCLPATRRRRAAVLGVAAATPGRRAGALVGVAAALQPAMLLFAPLLWLTGRRAAARTAAGTFAGCTVVSWIVLPEDSLAYWVHHMAGAGLGQLADSPSNQSLHGLLLRLGLHGAVELALFAVLACAVTVLGLRRAARYANDGQVLLAAAVTGCVVVAVSPAAWQHQQLWVLLTAVGRVGRRRQDRLVWPVFVVLVMTLGGEAMVPRVESIAFLGENAPLLAALLAAVAVPFLSRWAPEWERPVPTAAAAPSRRPSRIRGIPLLPDLPRPLSRPNLLLELLLIRVGYWAYSLVRAAAPDRRHLAEANGRDILAAEHMVHIDAEHWLNHKTAAVPWLESSLNFYYSTFHFLVPLALLGFLYWKLPAVYRTARTSLCAATLLALAGFWFYPLAPPRLMPGLGYIDTVNGPQDLAKPEFGVLTQISNQYAAMPSLHVGWSLWCGLLIVVLAPYLWLRAFGLLYPVLTTVVVMGTANHYILDAAGGVVVVLCGLGTQYVLTGRSPLSVTQDQPTARKAPEESVPERAVAPVC